MSAEANRSFTLFPMTRLASLPAFLFPAFVASIHSEAAPSSEACSDDSFAAGLATIDSRRRPRPAAPPLHPDLAMYLADLARIVEVVGTSALGGGASLPKAHRIDRAARFVFPATFFGFTPWCFA